MTYTGSCHCGAVKFQADLDIKSLLSCNCSICSKKGQLLVFTSEENFQLLSGEDHLSDYQFGKKRIHHHFCKICGITTFGRGQAPDGKKMRAINARCLDDVDLSQFPITNFDGKSL